MKKDDLLIKLGKHIRTLREGQGITQEELARMAKIDRSYLGAIERGERNLTVMMLEKVALQLKVTMRDIFPK